MCEDWPNVGRMGRPNSGLRSERGWCNVAISAPRANGEVVRWKKPQRADAIEVAVKPISVDVLIRVGHAARAPRRRRAGSASPHEGRFSAGDSASDERRFPGSAAHERRRALDDDRAGVGAEHLEPQANLPDECVRLEALA
jgi:hypothetical protein